MGRIDEAWKRYSKATSGPSVASTPDPHVRSSALSQYPPERPAPLAPDAPGPAMPVFLTRDGRPEAPVRAVTPVPHPVTASNVAPGPHPAVVPGPHAIAPATVAPATQPAPPAVTAPPLAVATGDQAIEPSARIVAVLQDAHASSGLRTVMVTGAGSREDHTGVAITLARALSELLPRVLLIDVDADSPTLQKSFGVRPERGNSDWPHTRWQSLPICEVTPHLSVLTAERLVPPGGFTSDRIGAVLDNCSMFDFVVLCTPPVSALPDAAQLARRAGAVVFVLSARAPFSVNERGMTQVGRTTIVGTVLSGVPGELPDTHTATDTASVTGRSAAPGAR